MLKQSAQFLLFFILLQLCAGCANKNTLLANPPDDLQKKIEAILPAAERFVLTNQETALKNGHPLTPENVRIARELGVARPGRVRVYMVSALPVPQDPELAAAAESLGYSSQGMLAYTYGYGIWIRQQAAGNRQIIAHELIHVRQAERMGLKKQIRQYLIQLYIFGYRKAPLEIEAYSGSAKY